MSSQGASPFFVRHKQTVQVTFFVVLFLTFVMVLFVPPTFQAVSVVAFPKSRRVSDSVSRLLSPAVLAAVPRESDTRLLVAPVPGGAGAALVVEGNNPEAAAQIATAWAESYAALERQPSLFVRAAEPPRRPIRPKPVQDIMSGAFLGGVLGLFFAFLRSLMGDRKKTATGEIIRPAT